MRRPPGFFAAISLLLACGGGGGNAAPPFTGTDAGPGSDAPADAGTGNAEAGTDASADVRPADDAPTSDAPPAFDSGGADTRFYVCAASGLIDLGTFLDGQTTEGADINAGGHVLVRSPDSHPASAFVWDPRTGARTQLVPPPGFVLGQISALNAGGAVVGSMLGGPNHAVLCRGECQDLGALGSATNLSVGIGLNDADQVIGVGVASGASIALHAVLWTSADGMKDLGTLGGPQSAPAAINASGQIAGSSQTDPTTEHAVLWEAGSPRDLGTLGGSSSKAVALNTAGQVVGSSTYASGERHAFIWQAGTMRDLGTLGGATSEAIAINANGQVVGSSTTATGESRLFTWETGTMTDLGTLGGDIAVARGGGIHIINDAGQIVGTSTTATGEAHAFLWEEGTMRDLGTLGGNASDAIAINASGQVTGKSLTAEGTTHAFVYDPNRCQPPRD